MYRVKTPILLALSTFACLTAQAGCDRGGSIVVPSNTPPPSTPVTPTDTQVTSPEDVGNGGADVWTPDPQDVGGTDVGTGPDVPTIPEPGPGESPILAPGCIDGDWDEDPPDPTADIQPEIASYDENQHYSFINDVLQKRYATGAFILAGGIANSSQGNCVDMFLSNKSTAQSVISSLSTLVHECGHFFDMSGGGWDGSLYVLTPTAQWTCSGGSIEAFGGLTFARSLITTDAFSDAWEPCSSWGAGAACDSYATIYLDGDPEDDTFDSGDQGFDMLLEEVTQYVNSLATGYAFHNEMSGSVSERDGILTFFWYLTRYLRMARLDYPQAYQLLSGDSCWRELILSIWGRGWYYLNLTEGLPQLGIEDDLLYELATTPVLLEEIQRLRNAAGC